MIRKMLRVDIDEVHELHSRIAKYKVSKRTMIQLYNQPNVDALIFEIVDEDEPDDRVLIGYLFALRDGWSSQIIDIGVTPLCQRKGFGRALINSLDNLLPDDVSVEAMADEDNAEFFYRSQMHCVAKYGDKFLYRRGWRFNKGRAPQQVYRMTS